MLLQLVIGRRNNLAPSSGRARTGCEEFPKGVQGNKGYHFIVESSPETPCRRLPNEKYFTEKIASGSDNIPLVTPVCRFALHKHLKNASLPAAESPRSQQREAQNVMAPPTLIYFDVPGRAGAIRLAFFIGGVEFEDKLVTFEELAASPTLKYVPVLQVYSR